LADPIDGGTDVNVRDWASSKAGFEAAVHLARETGCALFGNCVDVGGALSEEVDASCNCLIAGALHDLHNWYSVLHARAAEDLIVLHEVAFMAAWMDVKAVDGIWFSILQDVLCMRENLDLH
jgi:hypothetical protein